MSVMTPADLDKLADLVADRVAKRIAAAPKLLDRNQLSERLGISVPTIERLQAAGKIPVVKLGRRVQYDPDAVIARLSDAEKTRAASSSN